MNQKNSKVISIIFIAVIFLFGATTLVKCWAEVEQFAKAEGFTSKKIVFEEYIQDNFKSKNNWINLNGLFQKLIGATVINDSGGTDVYRLDNGQIMYTLDKQNMEYYFESVKNLYYYVQKKEIDFLYVQLPFKIQDNKIMPMGAQDFGNSNADVLVNMLNNENVPVFDVRENIKNEKLQYDELFFKTDHHWKPDTALWAAGLIADELNRCYGVVIEDNMYDIENYNIKTYEKWFLGSLGKRTGAWYAGTDDFDVITPKFETDFEFYALTSAGEEYRKGSFEDVMFKNEYIENKDYFNVNNYAGYIGGDYKLNKITNKSAPNDKTVLLVRDSFSCAMLPYLSLSSKETIAIDLRHYNEKTLVEYIDEHNIDIVIIAYNPSAFGTEQFEFGIK